MFETKAKRTVQHINSGWPGNPVSESGIPPDHCWQRGSPPHISGYWSEVPLLEFAVHPALLEASAAQMPDKLGIGNRPTTV